MGPVGPVSPMPNVSPGVGGEGVQSEAAAENATPVDAAAGEGAAGGGDVSAAVNVVARSKATAAKIISGTNRAGVRRASCAAGRPRCDEKRMRDGAERPDPSPVEKALDGWSHEPTKSITAQSPSSCWCQMILTKEG